ncbi:DUF262 domain-containing protein [Mycoplasma todarodis]|uniref:GmrSD restriction endonucleases N-terminal domain-containing protein n=1 Tax=Mycoplasma todarodis TaxID=1937191 RepID=A0A4R0XN20_9MOLU|nr:DUF262 domain-containing protein [Mycoplasma todarodis]TCG11951.1 hypothetical protein C4B25_00405 [Mycoplasma todarodis]
MRRAETTIMGMSILQLLNQYKNGLILFNEEYQRDFIWKDEYKHELILTIFKNFPIGTIIIYDNLLEKEVVDGMQRLSTISAFVNDLLILPNTISREIIKDNIQFIENENTKEANDILKKYFSNKNIRLKYSKLPLGLKSLFDIFQVSTTTITHTTYESVRRYFVKVQNQEKLKAGEIIRSLPNNKLVRIIREMPIKEFSEAISFNNKRSEIEKLLIAFHGIYNKKLGLNTPDKRIISYANKETEVSNLFVRRCNILFKDILSKKEEIINSSSIKTKAELKTLFLSRILSNKTEIVEITNLIKSIKKFISDTKFVNSNSPISLEIRQEFMKNEPLKFKVTRMFKGQHSPDDVWEMVGTLNEILLSQISEV